MLILDPTMLYEPLFTGMHSSGLDGPFDGDDADRIVSVLEEVNLRAVAVR